MGSWPGNGCATVAMGLWGLCWATAHNARGLLPLRLGLFHASMGQVGTLRGTGGGFQAQGLTELGGKWLGGGGRGKM